MKATIHECGNGLPGERSLPAYVPGDDGNLYRIVNIHGPIHTGGAGRGNYLYAEVELADYNDCEEDEEFPALAVVAQEEY